MCSLKINIYIILMCISFNVASVSRRNILKAFPGHDFTGLEVKTFRIPLSVILSATQQARAKRTTEKPSVTLVVPIQVDGDESDNEVDEVAIQPAEDAGDIPEDVVPDETNPEDNISEDVVDEQTTINPQQGVVGQAVRFPCQCVEGQCGCCTGVLLEQRLRMKACGNITFVPEEFVFDMRFSVNNNTVVRRRVSASDPPPVCFNPRRAPFVEVCAELSNVHVKNRNAHACLDVDANIGGFSVYSTSFNCFSLGASGVKTGQKIKPIKKPTGAPTATNLFGNNDDDDDDGDDEGIFGGGDDAGGLLGGDGGGVFGGGEGGGIFGGGDGPDFDGAFEGAGELIDY